MGALIWKDVIGYNGLYEISNYGDVKSIGRRGNKGTMLLKPLNIKGYHAVWLSKNNKRKRNQIHRLVATAFIDNPHNKPQVNHMDGVKTNNNVNNLEWNTCSENQLHSYRTGLVISQKGEQHGRAKLREQDVLDIRKLNKFFKQVELAKIFNVSKQSINLIVNNKQWVHLGGATNG